MQKAGVPVVPGSEGAINVDDPEIFKLAKKIGYPVIVKADRRRRRQRHAGGCHRGDVKERHSHGEERGESRLRQRRSLHRKNT